MKNIVTTDQQTMRYTRNEKNPNTIPQKVTKIQEKSARKCERNREEMQKQLENN